MIIIRDERSKATAESTILADNLFCMVPVKVPHSNSWSVSKLESNTFKIFHVSKRERKMDHDREDYY